MEVGMITRYGAPVHGREKQSLALFDEILAWGRKLVDEGKLTFFEPFLFSGGDMESERGFILVKGPVAEVFAVIESEDYRSFMSRAVLLTTHVHSEMLAVGEGFERRMDDYRRAVAAIGI